MNSFLTSVLTTNPKHQPPALPSDLPVSQEESRGHQVWVGGPLLEGPYIISIFHSIQLLLFKSMISPARYLNAHNNELYYNRIFS